MIEYLIHIDKLAFIWLNSFHTNEWDTAMLWLTHSAKWWPFPMFLVFYVFKNHTAKDALKLLLITVLAIIMSDLIASSVFKPYFARLRPCHDLSLALKMVTVGKCGGQYGFISSHAATSFALATMFMLFAKPNNVLYKILIVWAIIVSYSRIYLGVHFPLDIIFGSVLGSLTSFIIFHFYLLLNKIKRNKSNFL